MWDKGMRSSGGGSRQVRRVGDGAAGLDGLDAGCYTGGVTALTAPPPPGRFASAETGRIHYRELGAGEPTLLFIHGWGGSMDFWRANTPALAATRRVLLLDLPGHGLSDVPTTDCTIGRCAEAAVAVLDAAEVGQAVVVGHSLGAAVVCRFAREQPQRVRALVTVDGALIAYPVTPAQREEFLSQFHGPDYRDAVAKFIRALFRQRCDAALREQVVATILRTPQAVLVSAFASLLEAASWELAALPWPLLMLNAPSPLWNEAYLAQVRARAPQLEYQVIPGAGHFLMLERPDAFNAALAAFVARLSAGAAGGPGS
jgi:pimeloyl-ACP methyl ester carboxylesterase